MEKTKKTELKLKDVSSNKTIEKELEGVLNVIKDDKIQNGIIPKTPSVMIQKFAGRILKRGKSVYFNGHQYFVQPGTAWEDIDQFARKHISFSNEDFE